VTLRHPEFGPRGERVPMRERFTALKSVWPVIALFAFIIGGIYAGVFTPTEAAGMGVTGALILGFATGTLRLGALPAIFVESGRTTAMLFMVIFGSLVLGNYANLAGVTAYLNDFVAKYSITGMQLMLLFVVVCFVLGAIVESLSMILLTIPIFFPLFKAQGVDPIWFGIIVVVVTEISFIVPPLGLNLFVLKSTVPDLDTRLLYRGIMPFMYADFVRLALLIWLPAISLFLPNLMIR
jgi:C4-dicarboxylate transporter DctM subunit